MTVNTMPFLYTNHSRHGNLAINVHLSETLSRFKGTEDMRLVFTTTLSVDVAPHDDELRKAFIQLVTENARQVHPIAAMLSKGKPEFKLSLTDREGKQDLPLHGDEEVTQES